MSEETKERKLTIAWLGKTPGGKYEAAQVVEQSHFGSEFANQKGCDSPYRFVSSFAVDLHGTNSKTKFDKHEGWADLDVNAGPALAYIPVDLVNDTKQTVKEYNKTNGMGYAAVEEREARERKEREERESCANQSCCPNPGIPCYSWQCKDHNCCARFVIVVGPCQPDKDAQIADLKVELTAEKAKIEKIKKVVKNWKEGCSIMTMSEYVDRGRAYHNVLNLIKEVENQ